MSACRMVVQVVCPALDGVTPRFVKNVDDGPVRDIGDLYKRCYRRWGMFTSDVNALLDVEDASGITDPQAAW